MWKWLKYQIAYILNNKFDYCWAELVMWCEFGRGHVGKKTGCGYCDPDCGGE